MLLCFICKVYQFHIAQCINIEDVNIYKNKQIKERIIVMPAATAQTSFFLCSFLRSERDTLTEIGKSFNIDTTLMRAQKAMRYDNTDGIHRFK